MKITKIKTNGFLATIEGTEGILQLHFCPLIEKNDPIEWKKSFDQMVQKIEEAFKEEN